MIRLRTATEPASRWLVALAAFGVGLAAAAPARAADPSIPEQLFLEGKALMRDKQYAAACEKFKASHDLDRTATGTLLNLALCHEQTNRPASAWAEFRQVAAESSGHPGDKVAAARIALAGEHEAKLLPLLSHVVVVVRDPPSGLRLTLDEDPIDSATWDLPLPIDPGKHVLQATAPGKLPRRIEVAVGDTSGEQSIEIPPLASAPPPPPPPPATRNDARGRFRTVGIALGGVGIASLAVGLAFGSRARSRNDAAHQLCPGDVCRDAPTRDSASADLDSAKSAATVANVLSGVGVAALAGGVVLFILGSGGSDGDDAPRRAAARVSGLRLGVGGSGLLLAGSLR